MEIKLDARQIALAQKYTFQAAQTSVNKAFQKYRFRKEVQSSDTVCYYGIGAAKDYGILAA